MTTTAPADPAQAKAQEQRIDAAARDLLEDLIAGRRGLIIEPTTAMGLLQGLRVRLEPKS